MQIRLSLKPLVWVLVLLAVALFAIGFFPQLAAYAGNLDEDSSWIFFFGLSQEHNVPSWYSSTLLLLCAVVLSLIGLGARQSGRAYALHWLFLGLVFAYMSLDEAIMIHEYASLLFDLDGIFYYGWVIPAGVLVLVMGFAYLGFVRRLPAKSRVRFIVAGACYVGGALGIELVLGYWADVSGSDNAVYVAIDAVEESMEIAGLSIFLFALLDYCGGERGVVDLSIARPATVEEPEKDG